MNKKIVNIPKSTIIKAVMGDGDYRDKKEKLSFLEKKKTKSYYFTTGRLTRAQILVLLELHRLINTEGYGTYLEIKDIAASTDLSMQCVNKSIKELEAKKFITIGVKGYGYVSIYIDIKQGYSKESNSGGYYQMSSELLDYLLSLKKVDELRLALIGVLEDDFSRVKRQRTKLSMNSVRKIVPSSAYPKALSSFFPKENDAPCVIKFEKGSIIFELFDEYYGKYLSSLYESHALSALSEIQNTGIKINDKDKSDIILLSKEFGSDHIRIALSSLEKEHFLSSTPLGVQVRQVLSSFI